MASSSPRYFPALTGLRAFAALLVFFHHFGKGWLEGPFPLSPSALRLISEMYIGVTIFFTLSGYLITRTYMERLNSGQVRFGRYWLARFSRIYPAYFVLLLVHFYVAHAHPDLVQLFFSATLTQALSPPYLFSGLAPAWSLTVEECFYLLAPGIFWWIGSKPGRVRPVVVLGIFTAVLWFIGSSYLGPTMGWWTTEHKRIFVYNLFGRSGEFALGILAALFLKSSKKHRKSAQTRTQGLDLLFVASVALMFGSLSLLAWEGEHFRSWYGILSPVGVPTLWLVSFATIGLIHSGVSGGTLATTIFGNRFVEYAGRISYCFYLLNDEILMKKIMSLAGAAAGGYAFEQNGYASVLVVGTAAAVVYELIEKPAHRFFANWGARKEAKN